MSEVIAVDNDTVYVIEKSHVPPIVNEPDILKTIDWLELAKQKNALLQLVVKERGKQPVHVLDGLLNLIDAIQDRGEIRGFPVVYGYCRAEWEQDQAEAQDNVP